MEWVDVTGSMSMSIYLFGINTLVVECILIHCDCLSNASTMFVSVSLHGACVTLFVE